MPSLKRYGYLLVFIIPALMPLAAWLATHTAHPDLAAWFPLFFLFVLLPLADYAIGRDGGNPADAADIERMESERWYRWLTLACVPVQLALIAFSAWMFVALPFGWAGALGWVWSQGVVSGVLGINVAHELVHKRERLEQLAGGVLLASVGYATFKVEHVRGHHVHVSTPADASSAPFGSWSWAFVARALVANPANGWRLEAQRLRALGLPWWHWRNELVWWTALTLAIAAALGAAFGGAGVLFFALQALGAAASLEVINYVEHYGLARRRGADGRYERTTHHHSWNSNYLLSNLMLFQLQRHSDHHEHARRRYQALAHYEASPQLPGGYSAMFVLALVPPLWRRIIDPRVPRRLA
ncbi:MAG TPA: alkane 1-monooxygenase [Xanthomonadales bacterium]|nr:alkane 1-monooxygenase [Xanthomonadales bacterium]